MLSLPLLQQFTINKKILTVNNCIFITFTCFIASTFYYNRNRTILKLVVCIIRSETVCLPPYIVGNWQYENNWYCEAAIWQLQYLLSPALCSGARQPVHLRLSVVCRNPYTLYKKRSPTVVRIVERRGGICCCENTLFYWKLQIFSSKSACQIWILT